MSASQLVRWRRWAQRPAGVVLPLLVLLPLMLSFDTYEAIFDGINGATVQKALFVLATALVGTVLGFRVPPWPVWGMGIVIAAGYIVALVVNARVHSGFDFGMLFGAIGLIYPWLVFFVNWRPVRASARASAIALIAPLTVAASALLQFPWPDEFMLLKHEYTGALRVAAGLPPAYLAGMALVGVCGALWLWNQRRWYGLYLAALNVGILALTGTRGATACAAAVFLVMLVVAVIHRFPHWIAALCGAAIGIFLGTVLILPTFLERSSGAATGDGMFSGSGRGAAWKYFIAQIGDRPLTGFGPGSGSWLAARSSNNTVREYFVSPHNEFLRFAADIGIPLTAAFFAALIALIVLTMRKRKPGERVFVIATFAALLAYATFDNLLNAPQSAVTFALLTACLWSDAPRDAKVNASRADDESHVASKEDADVEQDLSTAGGSPSSPSTAVTSSSTRRDYRKSRGLPGK